MNLNGDEKRIRQLFRELSCDEQGRAPEFAGVIEAAHSRTQGTRHRTRSFAIAWAIAALCVGMLIALSFAVRQSKPQPPGAPMEAVVAPQPTEPTSNVTIPKVADKPGTTERPKLIKRIPRRGKSDDLAIRMKSLSAWQSPTASLLKAPGEEIFKSLPRLGESLQSIKSFSPGKFN